MGVNKDRPHILVLPEDDANREIANGFLLYPFLFDRRIQVLGVAGGWTQVLARFNSDHAAQMDRWPERLMILLIDFDRKVDRLEEVRSGLPARLSERLFTLGAWSNPEALRQAGLGSYEEIGFAMAKDCHEETSSTWGHELLRHNAAELSRLTRRAKSILFPQS